jgi:hypothetical protein
VKDNRADKRLTNRLFERLRDEHGFTGGYTVVISSR